MTSKTTEQAAEERNPFERHENLSNALLHAASHWSVDMYSWQNLLNEINLVCATLSQYKQKVEALEGENEELKWQVEALKIALVDAAKAIAESKHR